jgi:5-methylcytosine-specific restriction enzyme subunit McrC
MRPDVIVEQEGKVVLVVDAKWKRLPRTALITPDLYQVLAYCTGLGVERAVLVYAGRRRRVWDYTFPRSPVRIAVCVLNVAGDRAACERALHRLGRDLRRLR